MDGIIDIPDTSVTALVLPLKISFTNIEKSIGPLIKHGKNTPYKFEMTMELVSDIRALENSKVILKNAGAIKEVVMLVKEEKQKQKEKIAEGKAPKPDKKNKHKLKIVKKGKE